MLTVYEKDNCQACLFTKRTQNKHGVDYEVKPITDEVLAHAAELGFKSAPIVVPDGDWSKAWSGSNPTRMKAYTG